MKKNFLTAVAITVIAFFVAAEIAVAADVSFSGQLRSRFEYNEQTDANAATDGDDFIATRMRLNANVNINDSTSAFIQMQSQRIWGNATGGSGGGTTGSGNASFTPSDGDNSVGLHQAYFTLKNFAGTPADLKLGRQQVVLDGHRLFGHTGWTTGANTHDAVRLTHKGGNHTLTYAYILAGESADVGQTQDIDVHLAHANFQGILGGGLSLYYVAFLDGCGSSAGTSCNNLANDIHTIGFRQAGQLFGINYRGEYYHQWGDARADASLQTSQDFAANTVESVIDRDAYMFGLRIGKKFNNVAMKPSLTIWYDQLSGTDDGDISGNEWGTFNTLFDTGHKFYGHMDVFLSNRNLGTGALGLIDMALKGSIQPMPGWTVKAAFHWFETDTSASGNPNSVGSTVADGAGDELGTEVDLQLIHKYNANTKISAGYSIFAPSQLFVEQRSIVGSSELEWAYVMFDVKF